MMSIWKKTVSFARLCHPIMCLAKIRTVAQPLYTKICMAFKLISNDIIRKTEIRATLLAAFRYLATQIHLLY